jgi:preprotein translocase SecE subunit
MGFTQYLKDTRSELHHVAWPTRNETIVYTILVAGISVFVALYLGLFDFLFTSGLSRALSLTGNTSPVQVSNVQVGSTSASGVTISTSSIPVTKPQK